MRALVRRLDQRYAWVVVAAVFVVVMVAAGMRSAPGVFLVPIETDMHWTRASTSLAVSVGIALYGLMGPFAAALIMRFGLKRIIPGALVLMAVASVATTRVVEPWQLVLTWGVLSGVATGSIASVFAATIAGQWFRKRRGLAIGFLTAATQSGQLVFLPMLAGVSESAGWRWASLLIAVAALAVIPIFLLFVPESPAAVGIAPYGGTVVEPPQPGKGNPIVRAFTVLGGAMRVPRFWLLAGSFFVCGLSTNGLIGTHLIALCQDHGIPEQRASWLLAAMGIFDLIGTTASGWLSDRYNNWGLLGWYYGLRGLALIFLPFSDFGTGELAAFAIFYGLDWIATVPPTVRLTTEAFGEQDAPVVYGWIATGHQLGAATAAFGAGLIRSELDSYLAALIVAGLACVIAALTLTGAAIVRRRTAPVLVTD